MSNRRAAQSDIVIVGAGFAGMYALHRFRNQGLSVQVLEAGTDVGGTWYWNRYPGARCDVPSLEYSFGFSEELEQEWSWPEVFSAQPDILRYANHVAERFDLRRDIRFNTRIHSVAYQDKQQHWRLTSTDGRAFTGTWCVMATGCLSVPNKPELPGATEFQGLILHTGLWPKERVDLRNKRVGIIGTGSSGVQAIPELAKQADELTVFQRTPVYTVPANRKAMREAVQQIFKKNYRKIRRMQQANAGGISYFRPFRAARDYHVDTPGPVSEEQQSLDYDIKALSPEQLAARIRERGLGELLAFRDVYTDPEANEIANEFYRDAVRRMVDDPQVAQKLSPTTYGLGCKRQVLDRDYYATFNRSNVKLVDLHANPIERITATGIQTADAHHELDVLIYATGFDALTGALLKANITGRAGRTLSDKWKYGPQAYLGLQMQGFPNLFTITGPGSPSVLSNMLVAIEQHVNWIGDCIANLRHNNLRTIEPTEQAELNWIAHVNDVAKNTMFTAPSCNSWYLGANIQGKPRIFMPYAGGYARYREICEAIAEQGYSGFELS